MKVFAVNSSPRTGGASKTEIMLNRLTEGMRSAGAEVEIINLRKKKVNNCLGCFKCWTNSESLCVHKDDMTNELFPKWLASDIAVYASPLYHYSMNATMKTFIERTLPILNPAIEQRKNEERSYHPLRLKPPKIVMLSVAAFRENSVFEVLSHHMNYMFGKGLLAEIYRSSSESMVQEVFKGKLRDVLDATEKAGHEIVTTMAVSPETLSRIKQPIQ